MRSSQNTVDMQRIAQFCGRAEREEREYAQEQVADLLGMTVEQAQRAVQELLEREPWRGINQIDTHFGSDWFAVG